MLKGIDQYLIGLSPEPIMCLAICRVDHDIRLIGISPTKAVLAGRSSGLQVINECPQWAGVDTGPRLLDFHALRNRQGIFQIDTQVPDGAVHLGMPK